MALNNFYIPLKEIVDNPGNVYELTNAAIKRASQLAVVGGKTVENCEGKVVSASLNEIVHHTVSYKIGD